MIHEIRKTATLQYPYLRERYSKLDEEASFT